MPNPQLIVELTATTAKLRSSMNEAVGILKGFEKQAGFVGKTLGKVFNFSLGVGVIMGVKSLAGALGELAAKGDAAGDIAEAFKKLGGSTADIDRTKASLLGVVDSFELMRMANQGLLRGLPEFSKYFEQIAQLGARIAQSKGLGAAEGIQQVVDAMTSLKAKSLDMIGIHVTATDKAGIYRQAVEKLGDAIDRLPGLEDDVATANDRLSASLDESLKRMAMTINANSVLKDAFKGLADSIDLASQAAEYYAGDDLRAHAYRAKAAVDELTASLAKSKKLLAEDSGGSLMGFSTSEMEKANIATLEDQLANARKEWELFKKELGKPPTDTLVGHGDPFKLTDDEIAAAKKKFDDLAKSWQDTLSSNTQGGLQHGIELAIKLQDREAFDDMTKQLGERIKKSFIDNNMKAVEAGVTTLAAVAAEAETVAEREMDKWQSQFDQTAGEMGDKLEDELAEAFQKSADFWEDVFTKALDGGFSNIKDVLKQIAVGFAAELMAAMTGSFQGVSSLGGLGKVLAQEILLGGNSGGESLLSKGLDLAGLSNLLGGSQAVPGYLLSNGSVIAQSAAIPEGLTAVGSATAQSSTLLSSLSSAAPYIAAAAIAYSMFGRQIEKTISHILGRGIENPESKARKQFGDNITDQMRERFGENGRIVFFDPTGQLTQQNANKYGFDWGGSKKFDEGGWADTLTKNKDGQAFLGLAEAMTKAMGITEDVGGENALLLFENMGGSVDNLRLLVLQLGLNFADLEAAMVKAGLSGEKSWHEVEVALQGASEAFKPGLVAIADVKGAYDELIDSGGRGMAALKGLKDLATETMEGGGKTLEDMKKKMIEGGVSEADANVILEAIKGRGIKTLDELLGASDRISGGIIADIESKSAEIAKKWKDVEVNFQEQNKQLEEMKKKMEDLPKEVESTVTINYVSNLDEGTKQVLDASINGKIGLNVPVQAHAFGTVLNHPTYFSGTDGFHVAGEAGPEAIMPLETVNGKLGVRATGTWSRPDTQAMTVNIDARGAAPGVENKIWDVMRQISEDAVENAMRTLLRSQRRGGRSAAL